MPNNTFKKKFKKRTLIFTNMFNLSTVSFALEHLILFMTSEKILPLTCNRKEGGEL